MEIRSLGAQDGIAYRDVRLRALSAAPEAFASTFEEESRESDQFWRELLGRTERAMEATIFAIDRGDGRLAGTTFVRVSPQPPHESYVGAMWVDADLRGGGWGARLLETAEDFARGLGSTELELWVSASNPPAQRFYERAGYRLTGVEEAQPSRIVARMMVKPLGI